MTHFLRRIFSQTSIFIVLSIHFSYSQTRIEGIVKDNFDSPVASVNVVLKTGTDIITYAYTNKQGGYQLQTELTGEFIISFSSLSYKTMDLPITITESKNSIIKNVILEEYTQTLEEVVFTVDIPIKVKKDTVVLNASSFSDGTEEVVEDLLKKLPGVKVDDNGNISVRGKSIEKVMVEGDDIFERGYKLLTKNLDSELIDKVEILQNFSENSLLKGIENSNKVALNLKLQEDRKTALFGNASLGYGTKQFYENKANIISFRKKTKYYFFGNLNNTGLDPTGDIEQIIRPLSSYKLNYIGDDITNNHLIRINESQPNLKEERVNFNNAEFISINGIFNPTSKIKIKGLTFLNTDENDFFRNSTTQFLLEDEFTNEEIDKTRKKVITGFGKMDLQYNINENSRLEYIGKYNVSEQNHGSKLVFNDDQIDQVLDSDNTLLDHRVTFTKRTKNKNALLFTGRYIHNSKSQNYQVNPFIYQALFPERQDIDLANQKNSIQTNFLGFETNYITNVSKHYWDMRLGYKNNQEELLSTLILINEDQNTANSDSDYENNLIYKYNDIYGSLKYKYQLGNLALKATIETHQLFTQIYNEEIGSDDNFFYTIPSISMNWVLNETNQFLGLYRFKTKNYLLEDIYDNYILTNFRDFSRGLGGFDQLTGHSFLMNYIYGKWTDDFLINTSLVLQKDNDYLSTKNEISNNYTLSEKILLDNRFFYSINANLDKYIKAISSNLKIKGSLSETNFENIVNNNFLRTVKSTNYNYGTEIRSAFSGFFNFNFGTQWQTTSIKTSVFNSNTDVISFMDLTFTFSEKLLFTFKNERYYFGSLSRDNTYYFSDLDAQYVIKKNSLTLRFTAQNIWNTNTFANYFIEDTYINNTQYRILPRYFLLKLDFRF